MDGWRIAGRYFESCNCDAICPCRMVGGVPGGRSSTGTCMGVLSWAIDEGSAGELDLGGLNAALSCRYEDDEPGSPWTFVLYLDERGDAGQRDALESILLGRAGGPKILALPWVRKPSNLVAVRAAAISIAEGDLRVGEAITARATRPVETANRVSCIVPGHDIAGTELYADELRVEDEPFAWELAGNCAFAARFDYASS